MAMGKSEIYEAETQDGESNKKLSYLANILKSMGHEPQRNTGTYSVDTYLPEINKVLLLQKLQDTGFDNQTERIHFRLIKRALEKHSIPPTEALIVNSVELNAKKSREAQIEFLKKVGLSVESDTNPVDVESESTQWSTHFR